MPDSITVNNKTEILMLNQIFSSLFPTECDVESILTQVDPDQSGGAGGGSHGYHAVILILHVGHHGQLILATWQIMRDPD